jgi:hypothetical protein
MPKPLTPENTLSTGRPDLANQWHPSRNGDLRPSQVAVRSGKKFWWLCDAGHEWQATPGNRYASPGCPICSGRRTTRENSLGGTNSFLLAQFHITKNAPLTAFDIAPNSTKRIWWRCASGHEWQAKANGRSRGRGCPYCANKAVGADNNLAVVKPKLAAGWHPSLNGPLTPSQVTPGSHVKVWWRCHFGHEWKASVANRAATGCPHCSPQTSRLEVRIFTELEALFGKVEWRKKVAGVEVDVYLPSEKVGIEIDGHYWHAGKSMTDAAKNDRVARAGVTLVRVREAPLPMLGSLDLHFEPREAHQAILTRLLSSLGRAPGLTEDQKASARSYALAGRLIADDRYKALLAQLPGPGVGESLAERNPAVAAEWNTEKNGALSPHQVSIGSSLKVWWRCRDGHEWQAAVSGRTGAKASSCPYCTGRRASSTRNLATCYPELVREWNAERNAPSDPLTVPPHSGKKYWWRCARQHEWQATVDARARGTGCPYCAGNLTGPESSLLVTRPELVKEWDTERNAPLTPTEVTAGSDRKVWWRCTSGHEWQASVGSRSAGTGCPYCAGNLLTPQRALSAKHPELLAEWDNERNAPLTADRVSAGSSRPVWWRCSNGHEWQASPAVRGKGHGCRLCALARKVRINALEPAKIVKWANDYYAAHGKWPNQRSGDVDGEDGLTWNAIYMAFKSGMRGLPAGSSLSRFLAGKSK